MADLLLADLGGTQCRVGLADATGLLPDTARTYPNAAFTGLAPLLAAYLDEARPDRIRALCAGVAGPVRDGAAQLTNRAWFIDAADLAHATGAAHVHLINDLQAQAWALDDLSPSALAPLIPGRPDACGPRMVLGLGTGCNIAVAHRTASGLLVPPSESGHITLPDDPDLRPLHDHLRITHPHLPVEAALSGPGLTNLHEALTGNRLAPADILATGHPETLRLFTRILGHVAGNLCLSHMATGGLYLIGGTARAIAPHLGCGFRTAFTARGPYAGIMEAIPVSLVTDDTAALAGCARCLAHRV